MQHKIPSESEALELAMKLEASPIGEKWCMNDGDTFAAFQTHIATIGYQGRKISVGGTLVYMMQNKNPS